VKREGFRAYGSDYTPNFISFKIKFRFPFNEILELNIRFKTASVFFIWKTLSQKLKEFL